MFLFVDPVKKYNLSKYLRDKGDVYDFKFVKDESNHGKYVNHINF